MKRTFSHLHCWPYLLLQTYYTEYTNNTADRLRIVTSESRSWRGERFVEVRCWLRGGDNSTGAITSAELDSHGLLAAG